MSKRIRLGVVGCAAIAERMVLPAVKQSSYLELVAVASRTYSKAQNYAEKFSCEAIEGYDNLINRKDIDVLYMPLPTGMHVEWGLKALENNKHILFEKSLALNYTDAKKLVDKAIEKKLLIQENFMFEYHRQMVFIRELLAQQKLGAIRCVRSSFGFPPFNDKENIRYQKELGGGALLDAGAYTLKIAQLLLGDSLHVKAANLNYSKTKEVDIFGGIYMHDQNGIPIETAFGFDHFYQCSLEIWGNKGKLSTERIFTAGPGIKPVIKIHTADGEEIHELDSDNHFLNLLDDFGKSVMEGYSSFSNKYSAILNQSKLLNDTFEIASKTIINEH